jgi:hypothetical protein
MHRCIGDRVFKLGEFSTVFSHLKQSPDAQIDKSQHTGVLDLKCMAKIATGVLTLRAGNSSSYTPIIDRKFVAWVQQYIDWLETDSIALKEKASTK